MTEDRFRFWTERALTATFSEPGECETRATAFERTVRRRNMMEYAAGALVIVLFGALGVMFASAGEWLIAATNIAMVSAAIFVIAKLQRDGSVQARLPEQSCRDHLRGQLARQRDLLRGVPKWYLAPFLPGLLGFYIVITAKVAEHQGWDAAVEGVWLKVAGTLAFFVFIAWLNLHAARKIDREIGALDRA